MKASGERRLIRLMGGRFTQCSLDGYSIHLKVVNTGARRKESTGYEVSLVPEANVYTQANRPNLERYVRVAAFERATVSCELDH